jgi:hypothetical protein
MLTAEVIDLSLPGDALLQLRLSEKSVPVG